MRILNLYAGIGGNRALWGNKHDIVAVEKDPKIAEIYNKRFPKDTIVIGDANQALLNWHLEFDFIWSSPTKENINQEINFLSQFHKYAFCIESVNKIFHPHLKSKSIGSHHLWSNFNIPQVPNSYRIIDDAIQVDETLGLHILNCAIHYLNNK